MAQTVYILAAVTSLACAFMLWRGYSRSGTTLLLWSSLCFFGLALNNVLLFVDLVLVPGIDLSIWRSLAALAGLALLLYGLIWDTA
jgi:Family of unknown function (DUF5985)